MVTMYNKDEAFCYFVCFSLYSSLIRNRFLSLGAPSSSPSVRPRNCMSILSLPIWHLSLLISWTTMDSCLTMFGARHCGMVRLTFLNCIIPPSALSELLKLMWQLCESLALAYPVDICFIPIIIRAILLISPFEAPRLNPAFESISVMPRLTAGKPFKAFVLAVPLL